MMKTHSPPDDLRLQMIQRLNELTAQEGFESPAGYKCQVRIAHYYEHDLSNLYMAYEVNMRLIDHPYVQGEDLLLTDRPSDERSMLEKDLRRIKLYERICATAIGAMHDGEGDQDQLRESIGTYGYLVLQYPYWKGEKLRTIYRQTLYRDFWHAHGMCAGYYLSSFKENREMLERVRIVHHDYYIKLHKAHLAASTAR